MRNGLVIIGYGGMGEWHGYHLTHSVPRLISRALTTYARKEWRSPARTAFTPIPLMRKCFPTRGKHCNNSHPNNFHKPLAEEAMLRGKDVILEKPATMNAEEFAQLMELSKVTGRLLTTHQNRRWDADYNIVKKIYKERLLGDVYMLENRVQGSRQVLNGWRGVKENGGGMVYDWGVHLIDQYMDMIDSPVTEVYANLFFIVYRRGGR